MDRYPSPGSRVPPPATSPEPGPADAGQEVRGARGLAVVFPIGPVSRTLVTRQDLPIIATDVHTWPATALAMVDNENGTGSGVP